MCGEQGRHLHQPRRGLLAQQLDEALSLSLAPEPPEGFQKWQIGFARPIVFDALPLSQPKLVFVFVGKTSQKCAHQGRLAYPRLACHKDYLAFSIQGFLPVPVELGQLRLST